MDEKSLPPSVIKLMDSQPSHPNIFHSGGDCQAICLDVIATVNEDGPKYLGKCKLIHIRRILNAEPAPASFFQSTKHPLPEKLYQRANQ